MSWVSQFIKHNRKDIGAVGNVLKDVSPLLAFTPLGIPAAALAAMAGEGMRPGANFGSIVKSGAENAAIGGGAKAATGALRAAFAPSSSPFAATAASAAPAASSASAVPGASTAGQGFPAIDGSAIHAAALPSMQAAAQTGGDSLLSSFGHGAAKFGHFLNENPKLASGALSMFGPEGSLASSEAARARYELQLEQQRNAALEPLRRALTGQLGQLQINKYQVAPNPYGATQYSGGGTGGYP